MEEYWYKQKDLMQKVVIILLKKKLQCKSTFIKIIFIFSPKKNWANVIAEYSTKYPATNSASASGKSKGGLFVSANADK